jgi:Gliding motility associated protein GldN
MRTLLFAILLAYLPIASNAQIDDLLNDKNISYVATFETEHDFRLGNRLFKSQLQLLKAPTPTSDGCVDFVSDNWLSHWLLDGMAQGKHQAFKDIELLEKYDQKVLNSRITSIDTVITFDAATYTETVQVIRNEMSADDIKSFKTSQAIFYDKKSGNFQTRLLAIAPMVNKTDNNGKVVGSEPIAWLAMDGKLLNGFSAQSPDAAWAVLLLDRTNVLETSKLSVKKDEGKLSFALRVFQEAMSMKHPAESTQGYGCGEKLTKKDLENMLAPIDTVITFDPATSKETVQVIKNEFNPADLKQVMLAQEWYYDSRRNRVVNRLKSVAPIQDIHDENGNFLYTKLMFYLHFFSQI